MRERPILFSAPMVRALLDGTKTQTRRVAGLEVINAEAWRFEFRGITSGPGVPHFAFHDRESGAQVLVRSRHGQSGDRLWVRETWNWFDPDELPVERQGSRAPFTGAQGERKIHWVAAYAADGPLGRPWVDERDRWRPSIHMPRWASRLLLEITGVHIERLQDISEADARAEGVTLQQNAAYLGAAASAPHRREFFKLWEQINGAGSWAANPWVWVVEFRRVSP